ncbi:MAG: sugar transferase [Bacteroidetes bacterium]|nr:sugar transferase [Bacteroidota bacterium]
MEKKLQKIQVFKYIVFDYLSSVIAWFVFLAYRRINGSIDISTLKNQLITDKNLIIGFIAIPAFWFLLYYISGEYKNIFKRSRIGEFSQTLISSLIGTLIIFFVVLINQEVKTGAEYYRSFILLLFLHLSITSFFRLTFLTLAIKKIHKRIIGFNTIIIGSQKKAVQIYNELESQKKSSGNRILGFVNVNLYDEYLLASQVQKLGWFKDIKRIISEFKIEEAIIAIEPREHKNISHILADLYETDVEVKIIPEMHDIMLGSVKMSSIFGTPLIQIHQGLMPQWELSIKRFLDVVVSIAAIILLSPLFFATLIGVKLTSKGPVFYTHERIGLHGKPFKMHKFRSMFIDAEKNGPQLSCKDDPRITPFGKFMRKVRLDEIPQFFNVLIGNMSLVGPRPERQYYIDQIVKKAPHYKLLQKVKPGITSWGQVKFGYAENIDEMIERLKYDLLYLENMSLAVDFKIMIYTALIIMQGRGK